MAESADVAAMVDKLVGMKSNNQLDAKDAGASKTGLDKPQFTVSLTAGGKTTEVQFGDKLGSGDGVYAKVGGKDEIEVVPADVLEKIDRPAGAFRRLKLMDVQSLDIKQVALTDKKGSLKLEKAGDEWAMIAPIKTPADSSAVTDLLGQLTGLTATSFVEDPAAASDAMKTPSLTVSFSTQPSSTQPASAPASPPAMVTVTFGDKDLLKQNVYVKVSDSPFVALVGVAALDALRKKPLDLRDKRAMDLKPEEVSAFSIARHMPATTQPATKPAADVLVHVERRKEGSGVPFVSGAPATMSKEGEKLTLAGILPKQAAWVLAGNVTADEGEVTAFLGALQPLRVDKYLDKNPATQPTKSYTLTVRTAAAGGAIPVDHEIHFIDRGADQPLIGDYDGLTFEVGRAMLGRYLDGDFKPKPADAGGPPPGREFPGP
jgi:hypothetical protein